MIQLDMHDRLIEIFLITMMIFSVTLVSANQLNSWNYVTDVDVDLPFYNFPLPVPIFSSVTKNDLGQITGFSGYNLIQLGYYSKNYASPLKIDGLNAYLNFGTVLLIVPYLDVGIDYVTSSGFYFGIYVPVAFIGLNWIRSSFHKGPVPLLGVNFGFYSKNQ